MRKKKGISKYSYRVLLLLTAILFSSIAISKDKKTDNNATTISASDQRKYNEFFLEGIVEKEAGNYDAAFSLFEHARTINPKAPEALYELAQMYKAFFKGREAQTEELIKQAAQADTSNYYYQMELAVWWGKADSTQKKAAELGEQIYQRFPYNSDVLLFLAGTYNSMGDLNGMLRTLEKIELSEGKDADLSSDKARVYLAMGDTTLAINEMKELCKSDTANMEYRQDLADLYSTIGEKDSAEAIYNKVLKLDPSNEQALFNVMHTALQREDISSYKHALNLIANNATISDKIRFSAIKTEVDRARTQGEDSLKLTDFVRKAILSKQNTEPTVSAILLGLTMTKSLPADSLLQLKEEALKIHPSSSSCRNDMLSHYLKQDKLDKALHLCKQGIEYSPDEPIYYYYAGICLYKLEKNEESADMLKKAIKRIAADTQYTLVSDLYATLGDLLHEANHKEESYRAYDKALESNPENSLCLNNYAYYLSLEKKNLDKAEEMAERAMKLEPKNYNHIDTYAWILFIKNETAKARIYIDEMLRYMPEESNATAGVIEHAGDIYYVCGEKEAAIQFWKKALKLGVKSKTIKQKIQQKKYIAE